uniref:ATP-dependent DNA helicase n=1 Tax=Plectus sambesii TaxID=2011161 RepID=A0A914XLI5_9BILA
MNPKSQLLVDHPGQGSMNPIELDTTIKAKTLFEVACNKKMLIDWQMFCRDICCKWIQHHAVPIGGIDPATSNPLAIEIDESLFFKMKYHRGAGYEGKRMLGGVERGSEKCFMVEVDSILKGQGKNSVVVAWTGIAATLLPGGRTMHSQFKLPLHLFDNLMCNLNPASKEAEAIRDAAVIFWDEALMAPNCALKAINIALRYIMRSKELFGGKTMALGGDFRQVLPVFRVASRSALIAFSLKSSTLWDKFKTIRLHQKMRTGPGEQDFSQWLLRLENSDLPSINDDSELPMSCLAENDLIDDIFRQEINTDNIDKVASKVILCPKNEATLQINNEALKRIPGPEKTYTSIDKVICLDGEDPSEYPKEIFYFLTPTGMPPHKLILKVGAIVMLLRNLNIKMGLCNGTRLAIR